MKEISTCGFPQIGHICFFYLMLFGHRRDRLSQPSCKSAPLEGDMTADSVQIMILTGGEGTRSVRKALTPWSIVVAVCLLLQETNLNLPCAVHPRTRSGIPLSNNHHSEPTSMLSFVLFRNIPLDKLHNTGTTLPQCVSTTWIPVHCI